MSHDHGQTCECMVTHRPAPLELERHHIWPRGMGGPDTEDNVVFVCPTTHTNTHELLRVMVKRQQVVPYRELREVIEQPLSQYAYELAVDGFHRWQDGVAS